MPTRRLLFIDASGVTAHHWQLGHVREEGSFANDEPGLEAFGEYLHQHSSSLFYLLADVAEEGFQSEDVPFVRGGDRNALIERRLSQYFYGTPLSVAISLGRNREGRRDEKILFTALTRYQHFEPWLLAMRHADVQLAGLFSMPMAVAALVDNLVRGVPQMLVLSATRGGLRQTFFDNGKLRFSRLTPMVTGSFEETSITAAIESEKIYQYLIGQRLIARGTPLSTLVLTHPSHFEIFRSRCRDTDELRFQLVDLVAQATQRGLKTPLREGNDENLFLHMLVRQTPPYQLAPAEDRHYFRLWQLRFALQSAAVVGLIGCVLFAAKQAYDFHSLTSRAAEVQSQIDMDRRRYDAAMQTLPKIPIGNDNLRTLTDRYGVLDRRSQGLEPMLQRLSASLATAPKVELTEVDWRTTNKLDDASPGNNAGRSVPAVADSEIGGNGYVVMDVFAHLPISMANDHRIQLDTIDSFVEDLRRQSDLQVRVISRPFDVESGKSLRSTGESTTQFEPPKFSIRLVQKL